MDDLLYKKLKSIKHDLSIEKFVEKLPINKIEELEDITYEDIAVFKSILYTKSISPYIFSNLPHTILPDNYE